MADLNLRLGRDALTIADNARDYLTTQGLDVKRDGAAALFVEPEIFEEALRLDATCGAQCVVLNTFNFAPLDLRKSNSLSKSEQLAQKTCALAKSFRIQHPMLRVEPCGLPLDRNSKASLNEHCNQYKFIGQLFNNTLIDGFLVTGFSDLTELKCAIIGLRKGSEKVIVFDASNFETDKPYPEDFAPAARIDEVINVENYPSIDHILEKSEGLVAKGQQFLYLKGGSVSQTSAVAAVTNGIYLK